jgi:hypothetical protein
VSVVVAWMNGEGASVRAASRLGRGCPHECCARRRRSVGAVVVEARVCSFGFV